LGQQQTLGAGDGVGQPVNPEQEPVGEYTATPFPTPQAAVQDSSPVNNGRHPCDPDEQQHTLGVAVGGPAVGASVLLMHAGNTGNTPARRSTQ
jgi:hypothetical protein